LSFFEGVAEPAGSVNTEILYLLNNYQMLLIIRVTNWFY